MSRPDHSLMPPTAELIALCQAQIALLVQGLKADWCAVYLTCEGATNAETALIPLAAYPTINDVAETRVPGSLLPDKGESTTAIAPFSKSPKVLPAVDLQEQFKEMAGEPKIFPLLDSVAEEVMGLLVARRSDRPWNRQELRQIEKIVGTLTMACRLDRQQRRLQQQASLNQQRQYLEQERLDDLLHQLRNPLTALRTFGKLLLKRLLAEDASRPAVQGIVRESDRLQELLEEFEIDLAAMEADIEDGTGKKMPILSEATTEAMTLPLSPDIPLKLEAVMVAEILHPLLISQQAIAEERHITFSAEVPTDLPAVRANPSALREVLNNLIDNALKYTPAGGSVWVKGGLQRSSQGKDWQGTAIEDTGYGIPTTDRDRIFERRYRGVQAEGDIQGTGLGLAIVKDLVERMQGEIEWMSPNGLGNGKESPGTSFVVWLPSQGEGEKHSRQRVN